MLTSRYNDDSYLILPVAYTKSYPSQTRRALLAVAASLLFACSSYANVVFEFIDKSTPLDKAGIGASETQLDSRTGTKVKLTTLDIIGQDGSLASSGAEHVTYVNYGLDAMGVNDATNPGRYDKDFQSFNPGEGWIFSFNVDVRLIEIDFGSPGKGAEMTLSSSAFDDVVLRDEIYSGTYSLAQLLVPAGTAVTLKMTSGADAVDTALVLDKFTVEAVGSD